MKNTKIVFIDLDGTLKDNNEKIDNKYVNMFKKLTDLGIKIVLCTGRGKIYTERVSKQLGASSYIITSNGAYIYNYLSDNDIYVSIINNEDLIFLDSIIKKYGFYFIANTIDGIYTNKNFENIGKKVVGSLEEINDKIVQVILQFDNIEKINIIREELKESKNLYIANSSKETKNKKLLFCDITNKDVSKGNAIEKVCTYLSISLSNSMAIGDSDNDIDMLLKAGIKVAMGNGCDDLKKLADIVTLSNDQNGVYLVLDRLYKEIVK